MALSIMFILEVVIVFSFFVTSLFMFVPKNDDAVHKIFFGLAICLGLLITFISATALPSNYKPQIIIAWLGLVPAGVGVIISVAKGKPNTAAKLLVMLTSIYGIVGYELLG